MRLLCVLLLLSFTGCQSFGDSPVFKVITNTGMGTGFGVTYNGKVFGLTAAHVCDKETSITTDTGRVLSVVDRNQAYDLCLLEYTGPTYPLVPRLLYQAEPTETFGYPWGVGPVYTVGKLMGVERHKSVFPYFSALHITNQTDSGASGGPLLQRGYVIGMILAVNIKDHSAYAISAQAIMAALDKRKVD